MQKTLVLATLLLAAAASSAFALRPPLHGPSDMNEGESVLGAAGPGGAATALGDTVWFGGSGTGNGTVVRGGVWTWEADSGEAPEFFEDGDPVGNQYRDGWTFEDRTARRGPSATGAGHFRPDGTYDFDFDGGGFAHRATTHANDGANDGPDPLDDPDHPAASAWSIWIGTNLYLNPEHCGWSRSAGYGDGWSQAVEKSFSVEAGSQGVQYDLRFYHRYACEVGFDTCWVEISLDGLYWDQVGSAGFPNGIYNGGDRLNPQPGPTGGLEIVNLLTWPTPAAGTLHVRFRIASDGFYADSSEGGDFFWAWQVDDIELLRNGVPQGLDDFETGMNGWRPEPAAGFDFDLTLDPDRPAGRIESLANLACPPLVDCPESCGLESRILLFADRDDCDLGDSFQDTFATSRPFAIGGPTNPDLDGAAGRLFSADIYLDGGAGFFETGMSVCWVHWPFDAGFCPYTPGAGEPGAGTVFNWAQTNFARCDYFSQSVGAQCLRAFVDDLSANLPASADSVIFHVGAFSTCRSLPACDFADSGAPFFDNLRVGVFDPEATAVFSVSLERYADSFPITNTGFPLTAPARMDAAHSITQSLGIENPMRWVRSDSAVTQVGSDLTAVVFRFAVERSPCQPDLDHPFFAAFPPSAPGSFPGGLLWHEARMDTSRRHGQPSPGSYMTCFHESDPRDGTCWTGNCPPIEPCDDILPDGLFTAGTNVYYFFEARDAATGRVTGTFPYARGRRPITTAAHHRDYWLQSNVLPALAPDCGGDYAHRMLVVNDFATNPVPGRGTVERTRLTATLASLGLEFDIYDQVGTNYSNNYDTIGRREDRPIQPPRPPYNGATDLMLDGYECIWHTSGLLDSGVMLSDQLTLSQFGGQPSIDQQKLETWLQGCTPGSNRLLVLEGTGWASFIDRNTTNGPAFLANRGVDVLASDYAEQLSAGDLRRCARIASSRPTDRFDSAAIFGSGCPDNLNVNVLAAAGDGEAVAHFVESLEDGDDPVDCADDVARPAWLAAIRETDPEHPCEKSAAMSFAFAELNPLDCQDQCLFDDYRINGENAELVIDLFQWAGCPIHADPIGVDPAAAPRFVNALQQAAPNPAHPQAVIRYSIAEKGRVVLRVFDVSGRLVRTLVDRVEEPRAAGFAVEWDLRNDAGRRVGSGVFLYEIEAPGFTAAKKLVILE